MRRAQARQKCSLAADRNQAQNDAVHVQTRFTTWAVLVLLIPLAGLPQTPPRAPALAAEARIDLNHATADELMKVPGMTRSWAGRIVRFRPYRTKRDLLDRGIVTSQVYDRIKDSVIAHRDKQ